MRQLSWKIVKWPAKGEFRISRSALTEFVTVQVTIAQDGTIGRAECRPYARYGETADHVIGQIHSVQTEIETGCTIRDFQQLLKAGAARNALDCALWDLEAKLSGKPIWELINVPQPRPRETAFTLSIDTPENMANAATQASQFSILKMKTGADGGLSAIQAVLKARPNARLIIDANEAMKPEDLEEVQSLPGAERIALIEQPYKSALDRENLFTSQDGVKICADESLHTSNDLQGLWDVGYRAINVKLDKSGGLSEAFKIMRKSKEMGFQIMAGCMVGSSLAMAPMVILESFADFIDLDGPLLLDSDFDPPLTYKGGKVFPPSKKLWG